MKKTKEIIGLPIISIFDGTEIGMVRNIIINAEDRTFSYIIVDNGLHLLGAKVISTDRVLGIGEHAVTVEDENVVSMISKIPAAMDLLEKNVQIIGSKVLTRKGKLAGEITEIFVDEEERCRILGMEFLPLRGDGSAKFLPDKCIVTYGKHLIIVTDAFESMLSNLAKFPVHADRKPGIAENDPYYQADTGTMHIASDYYTLKNEESRLNYSASAPAAQSAATAAPAPAYPAAPAAAYSAAPATAYSAAPSPASPAAPASVAAVVTAATATPDAAFETTAPEPAPDYASSSASAYAAAQEPLEIDAPSYDETAGAGADPADAEGAQEETMEKKTPEIVSGASFTFNSNTVMPEKAARAAAVGFGAPGFSAQAAPADAVTGAAVTDAVNAPENAPAEFMQKAAGLSRPEPLIGGEIIGPASAAVEGVPSNNGSPQAGAEETARPPESGAQTVGEIVYVPPETEAPAPVEIEAPEISAARPGPVGTITDGGAAEDESARDDEYGEGAGTSREDTIENETYLFEQRQTRYLIGRVVTKTILDNKGNILVDEGVRITADVIEKIRTNGRMVQLVMNNRS